MSGIANALFPVFAVIVLGYVFRKARFVPDGFWEPAERVTFYLFFPALLTRNTAQADLESLRVAPMALALLGGIAAVVGLCFAARRALALGGPAFTSLVQSAIRPNVYVAIAAAVALYGNDGLTAVSLCVAVVVPSVNLISVVVLVRYARGGSLSWMRIAALVGSNPLILACGVGVALNVGGIGLPPLIGPLLEILSRASLPVGLLAVGAGLEPAVLSRAGPGVATAACLKLIVFPLTTWLLCETIGLTGSAASVAVLTASVPVSASAYVMARQMGGDAMLMAGAITATTLAGAVTMPLILAFRL